MIQEFSDDVPEIHFIIKNENEYLSVFTCEKRSSLSLSFILNKLNSTMKRNKLDEKFVLPTENDLILIRQRDNIRITKSTFRYFKFNGGEVIIVQLEKKVQENPII